jgi:hypothetical protein
MGATLDPLLVTSHLGIEPTYSHRAGDPNIGPSGRRYADFREGLWALDSPLPLASSVAEQFQAFVNLLRSKEVEITELRAWGYDLDLYLSVFEFEGDEGFFFPPDSLQTLGSLGIGLNLDIYSKDS